MFIPDSDQDALCDMCGMPLGGAHIRWYLKRLLLTLHPQCAHSLGARLRANANKFYRLLQERSAYEDPWLH